MTYVLDTSALIAYLKAERAGGQVRDMLSRGASDILVPFMTIMETQYVLGRALPSSQIEPLILAVRSMGAPIVESNPAWGAAAARLKARGGLSLADAWIASLALIHDAQLMHSDPEFDRVEGLRSLRLR